MNVTRNNLAERVGKVMLTISDVIHALDDKDKEITELREQKDREIAALRDRLVFYEPDAFDEEDA